jgi:pimeloyl-ACP methyl ester carboxylesterase
MTATIDHAHVDANGITFHVASTRGADGPPILCLHGFPEGWMSWRPVMERLPDRPIYAPDLRGYPGTTVPRRGYDVFTLTDDVRALIEALGLERPVIVSHDWGAELAWIFAHRYSRLIRKLVVVNGTHPRTLVRAVVRFEDWQPLRLAFVPLIALPGLAETLFTTRLGRRAMRWTFLVREGSKGGMDRALVDELVRRFQKPRDLRGPASYYRQMVATVLLPKRRARLYRTYDTPVTVPVTAVWGQEDEALTERIGKKSARDAGCEVEWRPLPGVGHFVDLEAPDALASEIERAARSVSDEAHRLATGGDSHG